MSTLKDILIKMKILALIAGIIAFGALIYGILFDHSGKKPKMVEKCENSKTGDYSKLLMIIIVGVFVLLATLSDIIK